MWEILKSIQDTASKLGETASDVAGKVASTASEIGENVVGSALDIGHVAAEFASQTSQSAIVTIQNTGEKVGEIGSSALGIIGDAGVNASSMIIGTGGSIINATGQASQFTVSSIQSNLSNLFQSNIEVLTLPVFLLPTGGGSKDIICLLEFDHIASKLNLGEAFLPKIEIWAGSNDIDSKFLSNLIQSELTKKIKSLDHSLFDQQIQKLEANRSEAEQGIGSSVVVTASAIGTMFFITNPIFYLLLPAIAITSGTNTLSRISSYIGCSKGISDEANKREDWKRELQKVEDNLISSNQYLLEIAQQIRIHPLLKEVSNSFRELDRLDLCDQEPFEFTNHTERIIELLSEKNYINSLPKEYHPLLMVIIELST